MSFMVSSCDDLPGEGRLHIFLLRVFEELPVEAPRLPLPLPFLPLPYLSHGLLMYFHIWN